MLCGWKSIGENGKVLETCVILLCSVIPKKFEMQKIKNAKEISIVRDTAARVICVELNIILQDFIDYWLRTVR